MTSTNRITLLGFFVCCSFLFLSCEETIVPHDHITNSSREIAHSLDSLTISTLSVSATYNGMPSYPPRQMLASITISLELSNNYSTLALDSLLIVRGAVLSASGDSARMVFPFTSVTKVNGADWTAHLDSGQKDSIWCTYSFSHDELVCGDSVIVRVEITDRHGNSQFVDSPTIRYNCSY
jgi:hypothetical protein